MTDNKGLIECPDGPINLTDENFEEAVKKYKALIVDFWAPWCMPCKILAPTVESLAKKHQGTVVFGKINIDENESIPAKYNIMSIPTLIVFKDGKPVEQIVGVVPEKTIEEKIFSS